MSQATTVAAVKYYNNSLSLPRRLFFGLTFNILLVASSYVSIPLPFTPVPITAQTMIVLACGLFLGPLWGSGAVMAYLLEGAFGLPVFAGGAAGMARLVGPTGGYLFGFVLAAFAVGQLSRSTRSMTYFKLVGVLTLGTALIFACGLAVLSLFVSGQILLLTGFFPFLPGAAFKITVTSALLATYKRLR